MLLTPTIPLSRVNRPTIHLYQEYQRFLPDAQVITFTDLDGKLRAIKPDVTLSIAKTAQPAPGECKRFYYNEEV